MSIRTLILAASVLLAFSALALPASAQDACTAQARAFDAAMAGKALGAITRAAAPFLEPGCPGEARQKVKRLTALAHLIEAERLAKAGAAPAERIAILKAGLAYAHRWELHASIGDLIQAGKADFAAASLAYQMALATINDPQLTPTAPPKAEIERIMRLANQTRAVAPVFVAGRGVLTRDVRGVDVVAVPIPVTFQFKTADMDEKGRQYADEAAKFITDQGSARIKLIGHTDPVGSDAYNDDLSLKRATAFKNYLVAKGYSANLIEVAGVGKRRPPVIEDAAQYTPEQLHQMHRRVEVCLKGGASGETCQ